MTNKEFYLHKHYGIDITKKSESKPKEKKNNVYMLVHDQTKQILIHGLYSLCRWKYQQMTMFEQKQYSIKPYKN